MTSSPDRGSSPKKTSPRKKINKKSPGRIIAILSGCSLLVILLLWGTWPLYGSRTHHSDIIHIPARASEKSVEDTLIRHYGEKFAGSVIRIARWMNADFSTRHGAYNIDEGSSAISVAKTLTTGNQFPVEVSINGFRNMDLLAERLARRLDFQADSLSVLIKHPDILSKYDLSSEEAPCLFIDGSYSLLWSDSPQTVIEKFGKRFNEVWNEERQAKAQALGLTPAQVMTLASIVDEETAKEDEKPTIARLYLNRLNKKMRLQADPTVRFAVGDFSIRRVTNEHLRYQSPYNTYIYPGLPPGPIRTTSEKTIDAVLQAPANDYLYMCAKEDFSGYHNFASDFETHKENARRYRQALDERGIK